MKKSARLLTLFLSLVLLFSLAACNSDNTSSNGNAENSNTETSTPENTGTETNAEPQNRLEQILANGKLTIATSPDFPPNEFIDPDLSGQEQYSGAEMALARYIANELGVELEIQAMDFAACQTAVGTGLVDLAITGLSWNEERAEAWELSDYYNVKDGEPTQGVVVLEENASLYNTEADFDGKTVAAQNASVQHSLVEQHLIPNGAEIQLVTNLQDAVNMLLTGRVDAVAMEIVNGDAVLRQHSGLAFTNYVFDYYDMGTVLAAPKGETELIARVNEIIAEVNEQGLFEQWRLEAVERSAELGLELGE